MEVETGNDRQNKKMVVSQSIVLPELSWKLRLHSIWIAMSWFPYLFNGYCAGSWNNDDSNLTSSHEAPTQ